MEEEKKEMSELDMKKVIEKLVDKINSKKSPKAREKLTKVLCKIQIEGELPYKALGMDDHLIEDFYALAYRNYRSGNFKEAQLTFKILTTLKPTSSRFFMGLAACHQMLKEYDEAISYYLIAGALDPETPLPYYHAADCFEKLGVPLACTNMLDVVKMVAGDNPKYAKISGRSEAMKEGIFNQITKLVKAKGS